MMIFYVNDPLSLSIICDKALGFSGSSRFTVIGVN